MILGFLIGINNLSGSPLPFRPVQETVIKKIKTKTNKLITISLITGSGASANTIKISTKGFLKDVPVLIKDADPFKKVLVGDLDKNGFDEIYIITQSAGSGSDETVYGYTSLKDQQLGKISIPKLTEKGYMGHDDFSLSGTVLKRSYPVYKEKEASCCPSGGSKTLTYTLKNTQLMLSK